ncbi:hypothetical protein [Paenibacillus chitinolyticus]|uniref:hypothetical protein n=1 Tax=Paenibacillus chitinolyticus TaxID=79263 RepID=UPI003CFCB902
MKRMMVVIKILILFLIVTGCSYISPEKKSFIDKWEEDIRYLARELPSRHVDAFSRITQGQFNNKITDLLAQVPRLNEQQIKVKLLELVADIGDGHTYLQFPVQESLPFSLLQFSDGIYVVGADSSYSSLLGKKLMQINGTPIDRVKDKYRSIISHDNEYSVTARFPDYLKNVDFLYGLNFAKPGQTISFRFADNNGVTEEIKTSGTKENNRSISLKTASVPLFMQNSSKNYWFASLPEKKAIYIKYNQCLEMADKPVNDFIQDILDQITQHPTNKLIIDFRYNGGGRSGLLNGLIDPIDKLNKAGSLKTYLFINNASASAAVSDAFTFKKELGGILIGQPTSSKPDMFGNVQTFALPNSKTVVYYTTKKFILIGNKKIDSLYPDIDIDWTMQDFLEGKDTDMDYVFLND